MNLGETIKHFRMERGLTQIDLAVAVGVSPGFISLIENNKRVPALAFLKKVSTAVRVPIPILVFWSMDELDLPESKRDIYRSISPMLKEMISSTLL